jgi:long-subunit acyl-CoA synthetase (AMP-forming)
MKRILAALFDHAKRRAHQPALVGESGPLTYAQLAQAVEVCAHRFRAERWSVVGLLLDNSPAWAIADLGAAHAGCTVVPLPAFFSDAQLRHALIDAGVQVVITDCPERLDRLGAPHIVGRGFLTIDSALLALREFSSAAAPAGSHAKITYTSGTTGAPKGVCLSAPAIEAVTAALLERVGRDAAVRHLALLPLATLLENIGGVYLPLLAGGTSTLLPGEAVGLLGAAGLDPARLVTALREHRAASAILIPQMLQALVERATALPEARFLAVGGAPVSHELLRRAADLGLPVYEGYGLSECASVVALNAPGAHRSGSVGRPLDHVRLRIAADGEIHVRGAWFGGYLHDTASAAGPGEEFATGDLGYLDADGYLHLSGRKKNMFVTAYGRNVAPEWVERELTLQPAIAQAAVYGEGRPWNAAVIVARGGDVAAAVASANRLLPDYARIRAWVAADAPFGVANGQLTGTGRPRRETIWRDYGERIEQLYLQSTELEVT